MSYEQLDLFELTDVVCETAKRIDEGEIIHAGDKLKLAELMWEARRRMPGDREYGNWWRSTGVTYSLQWRAVLVRAGQRIAENGRPAINQVDCGEFSIKRFASTGNGWITATDDDDEDDAEPADEPADDGSNDEWYTPAWLFEALGLSFDLDVCAPEDRSLVTVPARRFYTETDDGLAQPWHGLVWCNPPYSSPTPWASQMISHGEGVWLSHIPINGLWCLDLWRHATAFRLFQGMEFVRPDGRRQRPAWWLQLVAFGARAAEALTSFTAPADVRGRFHPSHVLPGGDA